MLKLDLIKEKIIQLVRSRTALEYDARQGKNNQGMPVFASALAEALNGRRLVIDENDAEILLIGYTILYRRLQRALDRCLQSLSDYESRRDIQGWMNSRRENVNPHMDDYLDCLYAAAELYEFYESDLVKFLNHAPNETLEYKLALKRLRREACLICNVCKHNHAYMQSIDVVYNNGTRVAGFGVYQRQGAHVRLNKNAHKNKEAHSFNWSMKRLLCNLLQADINAATLIQRTENRRGMPPIKSIAYDLPFSRELLKICNRPLIAMPKEVTMPNLVLRDETIDIDHGYVGVKQGAGKLYAVLDVLGHRLSGEMPYHEGEVTANITFNEADLAGRPIAAMFRVKVKDIEVNDE